jgi:hypothetical protein
MFERRALQILHVVSADDRQAIFLAPLQKRRLARVSFRRSLIQWRCIIYQFNFVACMPVSQETTCITILGAWFKAAFPLRARRWVRRLTHRVPDFQAKGY